MPEEADADPSNLFQLQLLLMAWSGVGAILLALAVALGAFGAHALRARLDAYSIGVYERAVFYHFIHALGLLIVPLFLRADALSESVASLICWLLFAGVLIFCGSLYILAVSGVKALGAITPIGGLLFIVAWLVLGFMLLRRYFILQ
jgi:uncharacterized membrane protein YgdD (TMEM256/DUF423 family)